MRKGLAKALCLVLAIGTVLGMASCKKGDGGNTNANTALSKQNVFSYEKLKLGAGGNETNISELSISEMMYENGRIYLIGSIWTNDPNAGLPGYEGNEGTAGEEEGEDGAAGGDGSAATATPVPLSAGSTARFLPLSAASSIAPADPEVWTEEPVNPEDQWRNVYRIMSFLPDGSDLKAFNLEDNGENQNDSWINQVVFSNGRIYAVKTANTYDDSDPENPVWNEYTYLLCWDEEGKLFWEQDITSVLQKDDEYRWLSSLFVRNDGSPCAVCRGNELLLLIFDNEGNLTQEKPMKLANADTFDGIYPRKDGTLLVTSYNNEYTKRFASVYDPDKETEGELVELPDNLSRMSMYEGNDTDFVLTGNDGIYTYNLGDTEPKQVMNIVNSDLDSAWIGYVVVVDNDHMVLCYTDFVDYAQQVAVMTRKAPEDIPDKKALVLGTVNCTSDLRRRVVEFNKSNPQYRVILNDYSLYNTMNDYRAGYTQLNNDIIAGKMPDILTVDYYTDVENYVSKGLLADIGKLIEEDEELSKLEYMENAFDAYRVDGKLYRVFPSFNVQTMIAKKSVVGDVNGWNMDEFLQVAQSLPQGSSMFDSFTREGFLRQIMAYCGSDFIDISTGKCNFNSPEFTKMLEYANTLPEQIDYSGMDDSYWQEMQNQYRTGKTVLMPITLYRMRDLNYNINAQFGEDVSFVGFPNEEKNGSVISADYSYALSARCSDLDGAWEFVRYYLTEEYQTSDDMSYTFPVLKSQFLAMAQEATERPYWINENGEKEYYDETYYMNGEEITIDPLTKEQVDEIVAFVESVNRPSYEDEYILDLIEEESAPYFAGQKTAAAVVDIIQNRAQNYVNDKR